MRVPFKPFVVIILLLSILLSGCGTSTTASNWVELSADNTNVYVVNGSNLFAVNLANGTQAWQYPEKANARLGLYTKPVITSDGQILVPAYNNNLYSLSTSGTQNWTFSASKNRLVASPLVTDEFIYQPSTDNNLYALDHTGQLVWTFSAEGALWGTPVLDGSTLYVTSMDHSLYAVNKDTGAKIWATDLGGAITGSVALSADGILFAGTLTNKMVAVNAADGSIKWSVDVDGEVWSAPAINDGKIFFGDSANKFHCLNAADGSTAWTIDTTGIVIGSPLAIETGVVFGTEGGSLSAVDFEGKSLWNQTINGKLYTKPELSGDLILVGVTGGDSLVVAFHQDGSQVYVFTPSK